MFSENRAVFQHPFFQNLPAEHINVLKRMVETRTYSAGTALFEQGDLANSVYFIAEGCALLKARVPGGREVKLTTLNKGELLGELALKKNHRRSATAIAETPLTALCMDRGDLSALYAHYHPTSLVIMFRLARTLAQRIQETSPDAAHIRADNWENEEYSQDNGIIKEAEFGFAPFLPALSFFNRFSSANIASLLEMGNVITVPKNHMIPTKEEYHKNCFIVIRGAVETRLQGEHNRYQIEVLGPGSTFGESDWLLNQATSPLARALSRVTLLALPESCRTQLTDPERHLSFRFYNSMVDSLLSKLDTQTRGYTRRKQGAFTA